MQQAHGDKDKEHCCFIGYVVVISVFNLDVSVPFYPASFQWSFQSHKGHKGSNIGHHSLLKYQIITYYVHSVVTTVLQNNSMILIIVLTGTKSFKWAF